MTENGDNSSNGASGGNGAIPKLTLGQRVLAALPNLQRPTPTSPPSSPPPSSSPPSSSGRPDSGATQATDNAAKEVVTPDAVQAPGAAASPSVPPATRPTRGTPSGMTKEELTHVIKRIDDRERAIALGSAVLGLGVGIALTIAAVHFNTPHSKTHTSTGFIVFEGAVRVVLSAVVVLAAWNRRRSFVAFALLFLGTSMGGLFALPFWAVGIWLIFRVLKWQRELAAMTGGQARAARQARAGSDTKTGSRSATRPDAATRGREAAEARRRARAQRVAGRGAGGRRAKKQPEPTGPPPNKRYTPPGTTRPRPPS